MVWWEWLIVIALTAPGWVIMVFWLVTLATLGKAEP